MTGWQVMGAGSWLWMLAAILLVVGLVVLIVRGIGGRGASGDDDALQILRSRFARGEIDAEQFAKARETIGPGTRGGKGSQTGLILGVVLVVGLLAGALLASFAGFGGMMGAGMMGMMGPAPTAPPGTSVTMAGARFSPPDLEIKVGATVRWFNDDALPHTVTAADRGWDSGNLAPGAAFERRFDSAGTYAYVCLYHAWMTGTIVATAP